MVISVSGKCAYMDYNNSNVPSMGSNDHHYPDGQRQFIRNPGQGMATASMILGLAAIFTLFTVYIPFICGNLAIILAILSKGYGKKMLSTAKIGIGTALGGIALIITVVCSAVVLILSLSGDDLISFGRQMDQQFESQTGRELEDVLGESYEDIMKTYAELMGK